MRSVQVAKQLAAVLFVGVAILLGSVGVAHAQSQPSGPSGPSGPSCPSGVTTCSSSIPTISSSSRATTASSSSAAAGTTLPRTGGDMWIPLSLGGATVSLAIAARLFARRNPA